MSQQELLKKVIQVLEAVDIPYMVTGSIASSLQGEPRLTHDIDIIISVTTSSVKTLLKVFPPPDYHLDEGSIYEAIKTNYSFNLIDVKGGNKVDFWLLTDEPFDQSRFSRRYLEKFKDIKIYVSRPEDTILAKLRWAKFSNGSEKQFKDALRIYEVQHPNLDIEYIINWSKVLGIESLFERLLNEAKFI